MHSDCPPALSQSCSVGRIGDGTSFHTVVASGIVANQWYYLVGTFDQNANPSQTLWVNGVRYQGTGSFGASWGANDLRFGTQSAGDRYNLDGQLGGYVAILATVPSEAYVKASHKDFLLETFVEFGTPEPP